MDAKSAGNGRVWDWHLIPVQTFNSDAEQKLTEFNTKLRNLTLQNTRCDRSRGIRDDVTSGEPEVVPRERTWPPRPVAQLSQAIGRPFGTKYDNIDQNKAKKEGPGALEAKPEVEIWRRPDFLTRRPRFPIWPPTHHNVYLIPLPSFTGLTSKVGQSTQLLPVCKSTSVLTTMFFELRSISRLFGPFRALLNVLPVSELYSRKAFLAVDVRYRDNTGQNEAKKSAPGALKAKLEIEIWRRPVSLTQRPEFRFEQK